MYTKKELQDHIAALGISPTDTLLVHSSMKAIGEVDGGADTVLDAFIEYIADGQGLLIFPTHTWKQIAERNHVYDVQNESSCVGVLTNLFLQRSRVVRSFHPTHSVAAIGRDAMEYVSNEENINTPCGRKGCWGKLYDRSAKILFLGCPLKRNTYLHGVEEWNDIPDRLTDDFRTFTIIKPDGEVLMRPYRRHHCTTCEDISFNYDKMEKPLLETKIAIKGRIGDAESVVCEAVGMADLCSDFLKRNPDLFVDDLPVPEEWYREMIR